jgi:hypothetical protein
MVERENAVINNQIILRTNFRFSQTSDLFDPYAISKVEILDSDGSTVLQTITGANIIKDSTGQYHVVAAVIVAPKTIYDRWYFTPAAGATAITKTNTCIVWETAVAAGTVTPASDDASLLAAVKQAIANKLSGGAVQSYTIGGRSLQHCTLKELWELRKQLEKKISDAAGKGRTYAKFINADD